MNAVCIVLLVRALRVFFIQFLQLYSAVNGVLHFV
jgi:hypothetical protein